MMGCCPFRDFTFRVMSPCRKSVGLTLRASVVFISNRAATWVDMVITSGVSSPTSSWMDARSAYSFFRMVASSGV